MQESLRPTWKAIGCQSGVTKAADTERENWTITEEGTMAWKRKGLDKTINSSASQNMVEQYDSGEVA